MPRDVQLVTYKPEAAGTRKDRERSSRKTTRRKTERYEIYFDNKDHREPQIRVGDKVYIDRRQHAPCPSYSVKEFAQDDYNRRMRNKGGPGKETEFQPHTVVINEDSLLNKVTINRLIPVHILPKYAKQATNRESGSQNKTPSTLCTATKDSKRGYNDKKFEEYVVSLILHHVYILQGLYYLGSWSGTACKTTQWNQLHASPMFHRWMQETQSKATLKVLQKVGQKIQ